MIPAVSHPRIANELCSLVGDAVSRLPITKVPMVSVAPTNRWNERRVFLPLTSEKLPSLGNTQFAPYPYYMPFS
jgi:hypothetical protein